MAEVVVLSQHRRHIASLRSGPPEGYYAQHQRNRRRLLAVFWSGCGVLAVVLWLAVH